jgi:hemerythrin-like domain-containing protein
LIMQNSCQTQEKMVELLNLNPLNSTQLAQFANILKDHIRFEERELYNEIQHVATAEMLASLENIITHTDFIDNVEDEFWVAKTKI